MKTAKTMRIALALTITMTLPSLATACSNNDRDGIIESRRMTDNVRINRAGPMHDTRSEGLNFNDRRSDNLGLHRNTRVEVSQQLAEIIADMPEIDRANVLLTDNNAYISVFLEDGADGTDGSDRSHIDRRIGTDRVRGINRAERTDRAGQTDRALQRGDTFRGEGVTKSRTQLQMNREANRDDDRLDRTRMRRQFDQAQDVTTDLKDKIAREVKRHAPHIRNVYVSANPDFMDRLNGFIDQIQAGNPVRGLINELNTTVERMFPTNSGPNVSP